MPCTVFSTNADFLYHDCHVFAMNANFVYMVRIIVSDYADDRIYWIDAKLRAIASSNLQGQERRVVLTSYSQVRHPFAITVFEDHLYWTDWETESIRKVNKFHGKNPENVVISLYSPMDIQVYHPMRQPTGEHIYVHCQYT